MVLNISWTYLEYIHINYTIENILINRVTF